MTRKTAIAVLAFALGVAVTLVYFQISRPDRAGRSAEAQKITSPVDQANVLVTGTVVRDGKAVSGVVVSTQIWPNSSEEAAEPEGSRVDVLPLPSVRTGRDGGFVVTLDPATVPASHWEGEDTVNVEITVEPGQGMTVWNFPATRPHAAADGGTAGTKPTQSWSAGWASPDDDPAPAELRFEIGKHSHVVEVNNRSATAG